MKKILTLFVIAISVSGTTHAQYCMLPGRTSYSTLQPGILNFKLNTIDRTSLSVENPLSSPPVVVTTDSTKLERGKTYTVTIKHSRDSAFFPTSRNNIRVWIDYNNNKDFTDAGETVISSDLQTYGVFTGTFTVPATAPLGTTRLRATAKMSADAGHSVPTACDMPADPLSYHGEMEDYTVTIVPPTGISETETNNPTVIIYPNPSNGSIHISLSNNNPGELTIELLDMTGKLIATPINKGNAHLSEYSINLKSYNIDEGIYLVRVIDNNGASCHRILVNN